MLHRKMTESFIGEMAGQVLMLQKAVGFSISLCLFWKLPNSLCEPYSENWIQPCCVITIAYSSSLTILCVSYNWRAVFAWLVFNTNIAIV